MNRFQVFQTLFPEGQLFKITSIFTLTPRRHECVSLGLGKKHLLTEEENRPSCNQTNRLPGKRFSKPEPGACGPMDEVW